MLLSIRTKYIDNSFKPAPYGRRTTVYLLGFIPVYSWDHY